MPQCEYLTRLNAAQFEAATTIDGILMMYAGAGCGKTATIASRIAYMLDKGIDPSSILLLTFTNKAAGEMKDRVIKMAGSEGNKVTATTFHSFCAMILRKYAECVEIQNNFRILDENDAIDTIDICLTQYTNGKYGKDIPKDFPSKKAIQSIVSYCVDFKVGIEKAVTLRRFADIRLYDKDVIQIVSAYNAYKKAHNTLDYEDLLRLTFVLLTCNERVRRTLDAKYQYISCDEYQDTNDIQDDILNLLSRDYPNLAVVGDDNQSIYAFRGSNVKNIISFEQRHPGCHTVKLVENYRSTQEILDFANAVMAHATEGIEKKLHGHSNGEKPQLIHCRDSFTEASMIIDELKRIQESGDKLSDCAVLFRGGNDSINLESQLAAAQIPFRKYGGKKFVEYDCVRNSLAFLKTVSRPHDELSWFRILQLFPGIGKATARKLSDFITVDGLDATAEMPKNKKYLEWLNELKERYDKMSSANLNDCVNAFAADYYPLLCKRMIEQSNMAPARKKEELEKLETGDKERLKILCELAKNYKTIEEFLESFALDSNVSETADDYLTLSTVHSAKGLEYKYVFVLDCIEGGFPKLHDDSNAEVAEELRVFYVAITRAKKRLICYIPEFVQGKSRDISRFIDYTNVANTATTVRSTVFSAFSLWPVGF